MLAANNQQQSGLHFPIGGTRVDSPTDYTEFDFKTVQPFNRICISAKSLGLYWSYSSREPTLVLQYSEDGEHWTTACQQVVSDTKDEILINLDPVVYARYWRGFSLSSTSGYVVRGSKWPNLAIYYYEPGLVFTNPPANGAAIEMDCQLDRPIKNENWVLDFSCSIQFARG